MSRPTGYSIRSYGDMINCAPRMDAYRDALQRAITPGCRVLDIGAGTGIASLLAARFGAGKVIALEPNDAIELLIPTARANGLSDRIEVHRGLSTELELDEPVDVIISDLRGTMPLFETHIPTIMDVRRRLLRPDGVLIPGRDLLFAAPVENPKDYERCDLPWSSRPYGLDLEAGRASIINSYWSTRVLGEDLLADGQIWADIEYATVQSANHAGNLGFVSTRSGTFHGWLLWFETELLPGIGYSGEPGQPKLPYAQGFLPLPRPLEMQAGDSMRLALRANLVGGDYMWEWRTEHLPIDAGRDSTSYRQSNFQSQPGLLRRLQLRAPNVHPSLGKRAGIDRTGLGLLDGTLSMGDAARELARQYPQDFGDIQQALDHLGELHERYAAI